MTTSYVLIFLTLFALIGDGFVQTYLNHKVNQHYSMPHYETYVHRPRPHMNQGISLRSLMTPDSLYCDVFKQLIDDVYIGAYSIHNENLGENLLALFQEKITFKEHDVDKEKHFVKTIEDLKSLKVSDKKLEESYLFLMRGSEAKEGDPSGFPPLGTFFYPGDDKTSRPMFNLYDMPLQLIGSMFGEEAQKHIHKERETWVNKELSRQEAAAFLEDFKTIHHLTTHKYSHLLEFIKRLDEPPQ